jgi:hypothetical protein
MELQEIDVFVDKNGEVKIEVRGVQGQTCLDLTKNLEAILGGEIVTREMTAEAQENQVMLSQTQQLETGW